MLKNPVQWVWEVVFEMQLRSCSRPNMFVGWHSVEIFSITLSSHDQLYVEVSSWWSDIEPSRVLAEPTPPIFVYSSSSMLGPAHVDSDVCNLVSCKMCALVLRGVCECACLVS